MKIPYSWPAQSTLTSASVSSCLVPATGAVELRLWLPGKEGLNLAIRALGLRLSSALAPVYHQFVSVSWALLRNGSSFRQLDLDELLLPARSFSG